MVFAKPDKIKKVEYKKASTHGDGAIPVGAKGNVLKYISQNGSAKLLVDFGKYGKAIIPLSYLKEIN